MKNINISVSKLNVSYNKIYGAKKLIKNLLKNKYGVNLKFPIVSIPKKVYNIIDLTMSKRVKKFKLNDQVRENIKFLKQLKNYKGIRHKNSLPVRGQRTRTNAKTAKKKSK